MTRRTTLAVALTTLALAALCACGSTGTDRPASAVAPLRCPATTPPVHPRSDGGGARLGRNPTGAIECVTNLPPAKRSRLGVDGMLPTRTATVLARLLDAAKPAPRSLAQRCARRPPDTVLRFGYSTGQVDVLGSSVCRASGIAFVHDRGIVVPPVLASFVDGPGSGHVGSELMGLSLPDAITAGARSGRSVIISGELVDGSPRGTVLLQGETAAGTVPVIVAVGHSPRCLPDQLALQFVPGRAGAGQVAGTLLLRNVSSRWCRVEDRAAITGLVAGRAVTPTVHVDPANDLELSPDAMPARDTPARPDELVASILLSAGYRDDPTEPQGLCDRHRVVPRTWRVTLGSSTLTASNGRGTADASPVGAGGLITCRGSFGTGWFALQTG